MSGKLQAEIRQKRPFASPAAEAYLNVLRTADRLGEAFESVLKPFGLTPTQYNVLRILAGAGKAGLSWKAARLLPAEQFRLTQAAGS